MPYARYLLLRVSLVLATSYLVACSGESGGGGDTENLPPPPVEMSWGTFSINSAATHTINLDVNLDIAPGSATEMYVTNSASCEAGGSWEPVISQKPWTLVSTNQLNTVYMRFKDSTNNSPCLSASITHDNISPTVGVTTPVGGAIINLSNVNNLVFSGTCSESGEVRISGALSETANCLSGVWSTTLNSTALNDGPVSLSVNQVDLAGNISASVPLTLTKDTSPPAFTSLLVNGGAAATNITAVMISIAASDASEMLVSQTAFCAFGIWESFNTSKAWTLENINANNTIYVQLKDTNGNISDCQSISIIHDISPPALAILNPASGGFINSTHVGSYTLSGACSEEGAVVTLSGDATGSSLCVGGAWSLVRNLSGLAEGNVTFNVSQTDAVGNIGYASVTANKDTTLPMLTISSPAPGSVVNMINVAAFGVSGTCSEPGQVIQMSGPVSTSTTCSGGTWSVALNLSATAEGNISLSVMHLDLAGNSSVVSTLNLFKDTIAPTGTLSINGGAIYTSIAAVMLVMTTDSASHIYVTETAGCSSGGTWEAYVDNNPWNLNQLNDNNTVYVKMRDLAYNESACLSASISHDDIAPVWTNGPTHASLSNSLTSSPEVSFGLTADDGMGSGIWKYQYAVGTGTSGGQLNDVGVWTDISSSPFSVYSLSLSAGQTYYINLRVFDNAGNFVILSSSGWTVDVAAPSLTVTSPSSSAVLSHQDIKVTGACESGLTIEITYGSDLLGETTAVCTASTYSIYMLTIGSNGNRNFTVSQNDGVNTTSVSVNFIYSQNLEVRGQVLTSALDVNGNLFLGGNFTGVTRVSDNFLVRVNADGSRDSLWNIFSGFNAPVRAVVELIDGSVIAGGDFTTYRARPANRIARILANGDLDTNFSPLSGPNGFNNIVRTFLLDGTDLYVGGDFTNFKGAPANRIAKLNLTTYTLNTVFNPSSGANGATGSVYAIARSGSNIFIGGAFTAYRGAAANRVAKIDTSGVLDVTFNPSSGGNGTNNTVWALATDGSSLYLGGQFTDYRGLIANRVAKVDYSGNLDATFNPATGSNGTNNTVYALDLFGTDLLIGGTFTTYRGTTVNRIARVDSLGVLNSTFNSGSTAGVNNTIYAISVSGSSIYLSGLFTTFKGALANRVARLSSSGTLDTAFSPAGGNGTDGSVMTSHVNSNGKIYFGGYFSSYLPDTRAAYIVKIDPTGEVDTVFNDQSGPNGTNGVVRAILVDGNDLFIGGDFTQYRGAIANRVAKIDLASFNLDTSFNPTPGQNGANNIVRALMMFQGNLYLGGTFTNYRGTAANRVAKVDPMTGALDTAFSPTSGANGANNVVYSITNDGVDIYLGGQFTTYRGAAANRLAKVSTSGVLDTAFNPASGGNGTNNIVYALTWDGSYLYAGGSFTTYRGTTANHLARVLPTGALDTIFSPTVGSNGTNNTVYALSVDGPDLYVGGLFTTYRGTAANRIAKIDLSGVLDLNFNPAAGLNGVAGYNFAGGNTTTEVDSILVNNNRIGVFGNFSTYRGQPFNSQVWLYSNGQP